MGDSRGGRAGRGWGGECGRGRMGGGRMLWLGVDGRDLGEVGLHGVDEGWEIAALGRV